MNTQWRYLARNSGRGFIFELYRFPSVGKPFHDPEVRGNVQRLKKDGSWVHDPNDRGIWNEWLKGDFNEDDEISESKAMELMELWSKTKWPGRD